MALINFKMLRLPQEPGANTEEENKQAHRLSRQTFIVFVVTCAFLRARKQVVNFLDPHDFFFLVKMRCILIPESNQKTGKHI